MGRLLIIPLALLALLAGAMVWSGGGSRQTRADFSFINRGDIISLDPSKMTYLQDIRMANGMWEGLYAYDPKTLDPVPGVAESVEANAQKTMYTFHLRHNARWSNGDPVTARDFVFAWRRIIEEPDEYSYLHDYIQNVPAYEKAFLEHHKYLKAKLEYEKSGNKGTPPEPKPKPDYATVGVKALDDYTLQVTLGSPVAFFLDLVAFSPFFPLHQKSMAPFEERGPTGQITYRAEFARPPYLVTNGPYRLESWLFRQRLRLTANEYYWDRANVHTRTIDMIVVDDDMPKYQLFEAGTVDWLSEAPPELAPDLVERKNPSMHYAGAFGTAYLTVNCLPMLPEGGGKNPLADKRVRQALCLAIDKEQIVRNITRVGEQPATTYIPPRVFKGYDAGPGLGRDLDRARRLLAEAGFPDGKDFPPLTLLYRSDRNLQRDIVQNLARQWELNLGLKNFRIENAEPKAVKERVGGKTKRFHIAPSNWYGDYADPSTFTDKFKSTSLGNDCAWNNPEYDAACNQAVLEPDPVKRYQLLAKAEHILNEWVPIIPLYHPVNTYLFDANKIEGLYLHPRDTIMFKSLVVKRK